MTLWKKHIVDDFGAACNGVDSDGPALADFRKFALAHPGDEFVLTFPSGGTIITPSAGNVFDGISSKLIVDGRGSVWTGNSIGLGSGGIAVNDAGQTGWYGALTEDAAAGENSVTLLAPFDQTAPGMDCALFFPGGVGVMVGIDLQGEGYPANPFVFEFVKIAAVDAITGEVVFDEPLRNTYKKHWPNYDVYPSSGGVHGGAATLLRTSPAWGNAEFMFNHLYLVPVDGGQQVYSGVRKATFNDVTCIGTNVASGLTPTACADLTWNNVVIPNACTECDKLVGKFTVNGGAFFNIMFSSPSGGDLTIISDASIKTLSGTPRKCRLYRNTIDAFIPGTCGYGCTDELLLRDNVIRSVPQVGGSLDIDVDAPGLMSGGIITRGKSITPVRQNYIPGRHYAFGQYAGGPVVEGNPCTVVDFTDIVDGTRDASNVFITTDLANGFPSTLGDSLICRSMVVQKAFCASGNTGCDQVVDWSQGGAQDKPLGSYSNRTTKTFIPGHEHLQPLYLLGYVVSIDINVTTPYSGSNGSAMLRLRGAGDTNKQIDLKSVGKRTITPTAIANDQDVNGGVGGLGFDSLTPAGTEWFFSGVLHSERVWYYPDIGAQPPDEWPAFTITIRTDQGFAFVP